MPTDRSSITYQSKSDDELLRIAEHSQDLLPEDIGALITELHQRGLAAVRSHSPRAVSAESQQKVDSAHEQVGTLSKCRAENPFENSACWACGEDFSKYSRAFAEPDPELGQQFNDIVSRWEKHRKQKFGFYLLILIAFGLLALSQRRMLESSLVPFFIFVVIGGCFYLFFQRFFLLPSLLCPRCNRTTLHYGPQCPVCGEFIGQERTRQVIVQVQPFLTLTSRDRDFLVTASILYFLWAEEGRFGPLMTIRSSPMSNRGKLIRRQHKSKTEACSEHHRKYLMTMWICRSATRQEIRLRNGLSSVALSAGGKWGVTENLKAQAQRSSILRYACFVFLAIYAFLVFLQLHPRAGLPRYDSLD